MAKFSLSRPTGKPPNALQLRMGGMAQLQGLRLNANGIETESIKFEKMQTFPII
jgi:hypothetical protein